MKFRARYFASLLALVCCSQLAYGQTDPGYLGGLEGRRVITTAVPFLIISPDSRHAGMADVGAATPADPNAIYWNPAKLPFAENNSGLSISYTPWLRALVPDIDLSYLSFYTKLDELQSVGVAMRYFSLGDIAFTDITGTSLGDFRPYEFSLAGTYGRKLSDNFSVALALRFIYSNLAGNFASSNGVAAQPGSSVAGDISAYYQNDIELFDKDVHLGIGGDISNIGAKITYTNEADRDFIPTNLRLGGYLGFELDEYNTLGVALDMNKLLVPTQPLGYVDDSTGEFIIEHGMDPDVPVIQGMIQSFYDAPQGFGEELREINPSIGVEYWYDGQFAVRGGYFYEHRTKGNRQYLSLGLGIRYNVFGLDFAYLVPTNTAQTLQRSPLDNTMRFTLMFLLNGDGNEAGAPRSAASMMY